MLRHGDHSDYLDIGSAKRNCCFQTQEYEVKVKAADQEEDKDATAQTPALVYHTTSVKIRLLVYLAITSDLRYLSHSSTSRHISKSGSGFSGATRTKRRRCKFDAIGVRMEFSLVHRLLAN
jgi:hypothetical protein